MLLIGIGGLPGAGKTSLLNGCPVPIVSLDDIRADVVAQSPELSDESANTLSWALCDRTIRRHGDMGTPVIIIDAPHLLSHYRHRPPMALSGEHTTALILIDVSADVCLQRQHQRGRVVDHMMWQRYCDASDEYTHHPERWNGWQTHQRLNHAHARRALHGLVNSVATSAS